MDELCFVALLNSEPFLAQQRPQFLLFYLTGLQEFLEVDFVSVDAQQ